MKKISAWILLFLAVCGISFGLGNRAGFENGAKAAEDKRAKLYDVEFVGINARNGETEFWHHLLDQLQTGKSVIVRNSDFSYDCHAK